MLYSTFFQRAFDQVFHDVLLQKLPVIFCLDRAGLVGPDGPTHHGVFDIAFLRSIPNIIVTAPADGNEMYDLLFTAIKYLHVFFLYFYVFFYKVLMMVMIQR